MWNVSQKCFTDIFPRDKIVYLSPKAKDVLTTFNHDDIYVLGCYFAATIVGFTVKFVTFLSSASYHIMILIFKLGNFHVTLGATGDRGASLCHYKIKELGLRSAKLNVDPYFMRSSKNNFDIKEVSPVPLKKF